MKYFNIKYKILFLILIGINAVAQNVDLYQKEISTDNAIFKTISFGSKNDFGDFKNSENWIITNSEDNTIVNLNGNEINTYIFEKPGVYEIRYIESVKDKKNDEHEEEEHSSMPKKINIKVSPVKMQFDFSKIVFSRKIQKGINCDDIIISVPVEIIIKGSTAVRLKSPGLTIAGLGLDLIAKPVMEEIVISNGVQVLKYQLTGTANEEAYLQFDFFDFDNQVHSYNPIEIIK
jgi:hypothetical protein